jgi:NDP-sugar pyrophosphorylase family protein
MADFMHDFGEGEVLSHRHPNGGGIVANTTKVSHDSFVGEDAVVYGNAVVVNRCSIKNRVKVYGNAVISNAVSLEDDVEVFGNSEVKGGVIVFGPSKISVSPKIVLGFDHPVIITDDHIILGCHSFTHSDWKEKALAIIRVNGYPSKTTKQIHRLVSDLASIHFSLFSQEDIDDYFKSE